MITLSRLRRHFPHATDEQIDQAHGLLCHDIDPESYPGVRLWVAQCHNRPRNSELIMEALSEALGMHGVEAIQDGPDKTAYAPQATYLKTGDTYGPTIINIPSERIFRLTTLGDYVESLDEA